MKMLRDTILVRKIAKEKTSKIVMPDTIQDDWWRGEVKEIGKGAYDNNGNRIKPEVKVGDIVVFLPPKYETYPVVNVDGCECYILAERYIAAIE